LATFKLNGFRCWKVSSGKTRVGAVAWQLANEETTSAKENNLTIIKNRLIIVVTFIIFRVT
jgi:hypothetical protein